MSTKATHPLVLSFMLSCVDGPHHKDECESRLFDSNGSKYLLTRELKTEDLIRLSLSIAGFRENQAIAQNASEIQKYLQHRYGEPCVVSTEQKAYHFVLEIHTAKLKALECKQRQAYLRGIAGVQSFTLGWPLRQALLRLQTASMASADALVVYNKPEMPILVEQHSTHCTLVYPIWLAEGSSKAYATAFIQGFADSKRLGSSGDTPQCTYTAGPVPVPVPSHIQAVVAQASGGFVSIKILPRHVQDSKLDDMICNFLTFHDYIQYHVKCFKALIHSRMRKRMQSMILEFGQAKKHTRDVLAPINLN